MPVRQTHGLRPPESGSVLADNRPALTASSLRQACAVDIVAQCLQADPTGAALQELTRRLRSLPASNIWSEVQALIREARQREWLSRDAVLVHVTSLISRATQTRHKLDAGQAEEVLIALLMQTADPHPRSHEKTARLIALVRIVALLVQRPPEDSPLYPGQWVEWSMRLNQEAGPADLMYRLLKSDWIKPDRVNVPPHEDLRVVRMFAKGFGRDPKVSKLLPISCTQDQHLAFERLDMRRWIDSIERLCNEGLIAIESWKLAAVAKVFAEMQQDGISMSKTHAGRGVCVRLLAATWPLLRASEPSSRVVAEALHAMFGVFAGNAAGRTSDWLLDQGQRLDALYDFTVFGQQGDEWIVLLQANEYELPAAVIRALAAHVKQHAERAARDRGRAIDVSCEGTDEQVAAFASGYTQHAPSASEAHPDDELTALQQEMNEVLKTDSGIARRRVLRHLAQASILRLTAAAQTASREALLCLGWTMVCCLKLPECPSEMEGALMALVRRLEGLPLEAGELTRQTACDLLTVAAEAQWTSGHRSAMGILDTVAETMASDQWKDRRALLTPTQQARIEAILEEGVLSPRARWLLEEVLRQT